METKRGALVRQIKETLQEKDYLDSGHTLVQKPFSTDFLRYLLDVPSEEKLEKVLQAVQEDLSEEEMWKKVTTTGILKCPVKLVWDSKGRGPSLCIRHNRYLHWFRGYYFQISGTRNGLGSYGTSAFRMDYLLRECDDEGAREFIMVLSALTTFLDFSDSAFKAIHCDTDELNKFLAATAKECLRIDLAEDPVRRFISYLNVTTSLEKPTIEPEFLNVMLCTDGDGYALVTVAPTFINVCVKTNSCYKSYRLDYPDWLEDCESKSRFVRAFAEFLLKYAGYQVNYMAMYPMRIPGEHLEHLTANVPKITEKFSDLLDWIDDYCNNDFETMELF